MLLPMIVTVGLMSSVAMASPKAGAAEGTSPVSKIYVPVGFDDNDDVEVVLHGEFPDSCYKVGRTGATVDEKTHEIKVWAKSFHYTDASCQEMRSSFLQTVKLGFLPTGTYKVVFQDKPEITATLDVGARHSEAPDDYLYAPVDQAHVGAEKTGGQFLEISGEYPYMFTGCMRIKEVRITSYETGVLVALPIAEIVADDVCGADYKHAFTIKTPLDAALAKDTLVHVRVLHGDSVNSFYTLDKN